MSKIALSVIVYAPCLNNTTIKTNKKQMNSSADTYFNDPLSHHGLKILKDAEFSSILGIAVSIRILYELRNRRM